MLSAQYRGLNPFVFDGKMRILFESFLIGLAIVDFKAIRFFNALPKNESVNDLLHCFVLRSIKQRDQIIFDNLDRLIPL